MRARPIHQRVLELFLDRYTSRYNEIGGYWSFGFLVRANLNLEIDLLGEPYRGGRTAAESARGYAVAVFDYQLRVARVAGDRVRRHD
jgi:hypothetical protein